MRVLIQSTQTEAVYAIIPESTDYTTISSQRVSVDHYHKVYHILFIMEGYGQLQHTTSTLSLQPGVIALINPNETHIFKTGRSPLRYFTYNFHLIPFEQQEKQGSAPLTKTTKEEWGESSPLESLFSLSVQNGAIKYRNQDWPKIITMIKTFSKQTKSYIYDQYAGTTNHASSTWYHHHACNFFNTLLFTFFITPWHITKAASLPEDLLILKITTVLKSLITEKINLAVLAKHVGYNPSYLSSYFSRKTGVTIGLYFNRLKIQKACVLLKTTQKTITDIAYELGFSSSQHFSIRFKEIKKIAPKKYKNTSEGY